MHSAAERWNESFHPASFSLNGRAALHSGTLNLTLYYKAREEL